MFRDNMYIQFAMTTEDTTLVEKYSELLDGGDLKRVDVGIINAQFIETFVNSLFFPGEFLILQVNCLLLPSFIGNLEEKSGLPETTKKIHKSFIYYLKIDVCDDYKEEREVVRKMRGDKEQKKFNEMRYTAKLLLGPVNPKYDQLDQQKTMTCMCFTFPTA